MIAGGGSARKRDDEANFVKCRRLGVGVGEVKNEFPGGWRGSREDEKKGNYFL